MSRFEVGERVALFGGSGFLGDRLARLFQRVGIPVTVASRVNAKKFPAFVATDICNRTSLAAAFSEIRPTLVINAAAAGTNPVEPLDLVALQAVNVEAALCLRAEAERHGARQFVQLGSCFEYATCERPIEENFPTHAGTPYAASKLAATEQLLHSPSNCATVVLRLFGMWGPGEGKHRLVPQILAAAELGRSLPMTSGVQIRDFSYVDDMARMILEICFHKNIGQATIINVGSGRGTTVAEFARQVARVVGGEQWLQLGALPGRALEAQQLVSSTKKLASYLTAWPRTSIEEGIRHIKEGA